MTALSALAPATAPETRPGPAGQRGRGVWGHWLFAIAPTLEGPHRRHGDHADRDAILRWSRRAAPHRRLPRVPAPRGPTPPEHRGPHDRQTSSRRRLARAGARTAPGRQAGPFGRYWPAGLAGRWPLPAVLRRTQPGRGRPNAPECTHFAPASAEAAAEAAPEPGSPGQRVPVDPRTAVQGPACGANRLPAPDTRRRWAPADQPRYAVPGYARRHRRRRLPARCAGAHWRTIAVTMCPGKSGHK